MSDGRLRDLERAWVADEEDVEALDRFLEEARRCGVNAVERLAAASETPWAQLLRASLPLVRTRPGRAGGEGGTEELRGRRLFVLVRNMQYHHATLDVFEDGALDCWGFLDRALFEGRLDGTGRHHPPIACGVPTGESFSAHNLAQAKAGEAAWSTTPVDVGRAVDLLLRVLSAPGPRLDLEGEPTVQLGRVRQYKLGRSDASIVRVAGGRLVRGTTLPLFVRDGRTATLEPWIVWSDGLTQVGPRGPLRTIEDARRRFQAGELATRLRRGDRVELPGLGAFDVDGDPFCYVDPAERVREAQDELAQLEGGPGSVDRCREAHAAFLAVAAQPYVAAAVEPARERLREAYEAVPAHLRHYVGDMDSKDRDVREALGLD